MKIKINKWEFDVTNKDLILDNGSIYQCITLYHHSPSASMHSCYRATTTMSKKQFNQLIKENKLVDVTKEFNDRSPHRYINCKMWRFNVDQIQGETK